MTHRGPGPLQSQAGGDDPLVRGEGEQEEPGGGLALGHTQSDPWYIFVVVRPDTSRN